MVVYGSSPRLWGTRARHDRYGKTHLVHPHACGEHIRINLELRISTWFIPTPVGNTYLFSKSVMNSTVHPHACGEHAGIDRTSCTYDGSSPRLWGTQGERELSYVHARFIPTPVGNTMLKRHILFKGSVHPHACGEHGVHPAGRSPYPGSSPRLWGTHPKTYRYGLPSRFIPTPVGNTPLLRHEFRNKPVHPHACGEHIILRRARMVVYGSSPRLWGTRARHDRYGKTHLVHPHACGEHIRINLELRISTWFIPTPVGNTYLFSKSVMNSTVHPHACGEHAGIDRTSCTYDGSSPRLWGTQGERELSYVHARFIPTPVGNTMLKRHILFKGSVHPHACGEHGVHPAGRSPYPGSSPRLWGTHTGDEIHVGLDRFIPTPVGNTAEDKVNVSITPVHPHACGEHAPRFIPIPKISGSSPRLWGTRIFNGQLPCRNRFIPTPVGNTKPHNLVTKPHPVHPHACGEHCSL